MLSAVAVVVVPVRDDWDVCSAQPLGLGDAFVCSVRVWKNRPTSEKIRFAFLQHDICFLCENIHAQSAVQKVLLLCKLFTHKKTHIRDIKAWRNLERGETLDRFSVHMEIIIIT